MCVQSTVERIIFRNGSCFFPTIRPPKAVAAAAAAAAAAESDEGVAVELIDVWG